MAVTISLEKDAASNRQFLEKLTARLPQWFGQPDSNRRYGDQAEILEAWVARVDGQSAGLLLLKHHSPASAEIYWLGVDPTIIGMASGAPWSRLSSASSGTKG